MKIENFAGCLIIENGKVLLVQEKHKEAYGLWSLPLGHSEENENEKETAIRETKEETGLNVSLDKNKTLELQGREFKSTSNFDDNIINLTIFQAKITGGSLCIGNDILDIKWFSVDELNQIQLRGEWIKYFVDKLGYK